MRVIHILNHIRNCGNGVTNSVVELACQQAQAGLSVGIISGGGDYEDLIQSYGIKHFLLDQYSLKKNPPKLLQTVWRYQQIINEFKPDIVHAKCKWVLKLLSFLSWENLIN